MDRFASLWWEALAIAGRFEWTRTSSEFVGALYETAAETRCFWAPLITHDATSAGPDNQIREGDISATARSASAAGIGQEGDRVDAAEGLDVHQREVLKEWGVLACDHVLEQCAPGSRDDVADAAMALPDTSDERQHVGAAEAGELLELVDRDDETTIESLGDAFGEIEAQASEVVGHVDARERPDGGLEARRQGREGAAGIERRVEVLPEGCKDLERMVELVAEELVDDAERAGAQVRKSSREAARPPACRRQRNERR